MTKTNFRSAALAILVFGAGLASSSAFAQGRYAAPSDAGFVDVEPVDAAPLAGIVPPDVKGHFTCGFNEVHSHLERQSCAGTHYRY